jgi:hypothetical protein
MAFDIFRSRISVNSGETPFTEEAAQERYVRAVMRVLQALSHFSTFERGLFPFLTRRTVVVPEPARRHSGSCSIYAEGSGAAARPGITAGRSVLTFRAHFTPLYYCRDVLWDARAILFHELFHLRLARQQGQPRPRPVTRYPSGEEFIATTAANVLRSELGVPLRKGYDVVDPIYERLCAISSGSTAQSRPGHLAMRSRTPSLGTPGSLCSARPTAAHLRTFSAEFANRHREVLQAFQSVETNHFDALVACAASPFNPFRDL